MKILVVRASEGIGDLLMLTPVLRELKEQGNKVYLAIKKRPQYLEVFRSNKDIEKIIDIDLLCEKEFDKIIDLTSVAYPYERAGLPLSRTKIFALKAGIEVESEVPIYSVSNKVILDNCIAVHFFGAEERRSLSFKKAKSLILYLLNNTKYNLLILDTENYSISSSRIISCKDMNIYESAMHLAGCIYFLGIDSCWLHFAAALNVPGLSIFGSTNPETRVKYYENIKALYTKSSCRGCFYKECDLNYICMESISTKDIINELIKNEILL